MAEIYLENALTRMNNDVEWGISCVRRDNDSLTWDCCISGPARTAWEGGIFELTLIFPHDYPINPPRIEFKKPFFHPNVNPYSGAVVIDILSDLWRSISPQEILIVIQTTLGEPDVTELDKCENIEAGELYIVEKCEYDIKVRKIIAAQIS